MLIKISKRHNDVCATYIIKTAINKTSIILENIEITREKYVGEIKE